LTIPSDELLNGEHDLHIAISRRDINLRFLNKNVNIYSLESYKTCRFWFLNVFIVKIKPDLI